MTKATRNETVSKDPSLQRLEKRHRDLMAEIVDIGLVLRGSIVRTMNRCGNPTCRCKADPPKLHGPYHLWTRKVKGKTVGTTLPPEHIERCSAWNQNMRRLDNIVRQLEEIGLLAISLLLASRHGASRLRQPLLERNHRKP